jgi:hypothetical protein
MSGIETGYILKTGGLELRHRITGKEDTVFVAITYGNPSLLARTAARLVYLAKNLVPGQDMKMSEKYELEFAISVPPEVSKEEYENLIVKRDTDIKELFKVCGLGQWVSQLTPKAKTE